MESHLSSESLDHLSEERKLTRREEVMRMREERRREKEGNLTFKPTIKKPAKPATKETTNETRFEKLYSEAKKRKDNTDRKDKEGYSFKPTITSMGQTKQRSATPEGTSKRLYDAPGAGRPRRSTSVDKRSQKRSFSPQITQRGRSVERAGSLSSPTTRLYSQAQTQKENRQALAYKMNKEDSKECTFNPKTNTSVDSSSNLKTTSVPLAERMDKYLALREKRMEELKQKKKAEEAQTVTFKPVKYTSKSRSRSAERSRGGGDNGSVTSIAAGSDRGSPDDTVVSVFDRLTTQAPSRKPVVVVDKDEKEFTYQPALVSKRAPSPQRREEESKYGNIHNRLYQKGNEQRLEGQLRSEELRKEMERGHTFNPSVPHRNSPESPSKGAVFERLAASRQHMHGVLNQVKTEFEMDNCTFRPEINPTSDEISMKKNTKPVHLRLTEKGKEIHEEHLKRVAKKEEEELGACTFSPAIGKKSSKVVMMKRPDKTNVFERLASGDNGPNSPPVQENYPENVPKVVRRSSSNNSEGDSSPGKDKVKHQPTKNTNGADVFERLSRSSSEMDTDAHDRHQTSPSKANQKTEQLSGQSNRGVRSPGKEKKKEEDAITITEEEEAQLQLLMTQKMNEISAKVE